MKKTNSFVFSFLFGAAAGSILALLFTPKSGKQMREDLKNQAEDVYQNTLNKLSLEVKSLRAGLRRAIKSFKNAGLNLEGINDITEDIFADYDDENLPKREGMGRGKV
ncbi:MAG TPA: YtxH domain-containing protein [Ignavibacteriaceae bacterium]|nr:YtxH domain-containing protein [Ignavibacteriaceae bacterium]